MKKLKIVHVQVAPKLSGAQLFSLQIFKSLSDEIYDKYLIISSSESATDLQIEDLINSYQSCNVKIIWLATLKRRIGLHDIQCLLDFYRTFKSYDFDIVHTNSTKPGIVARIAASFAGVKKIVHTVHGISYHKYLPMHNRFLFYIIEIVATCFCHYNVCVNRYYLRYYNWLPFCKSLTIYNGYDFSLLGDFSRQSKFDSTSTSRSGKLICNLLFVGRLDNQKDPLTLLHSFKLLLEQHKSDYIDFTLSIVGDGDLYDACNQYCIINNLYPAVTFHGWASDPTRYYKTSDIFVCPSIFEAFGFTFVEASYFGLPIVATNVEGIPEVVIESKTGYLVRARSPQAVADAIYKIASQPKIYTKLSNMSRASVQERFSLKSMTNAYKEIYES